MIKKLINVIIACLFGLSAFTMGMAVNDLFSAQNTPAFTYDNLVSSEKVDFSTKEPVAPKAEDKKTSNTAKLPEGLEFYIPPERPSPKPRIKESQIKVLPDKVVINIKNAKWASFADTNSMDPVFDNGHYGIQITPESPDDIQIGDIISYTSEYGSIIHRVIEIGHDEKGWFAIVKGDNNDIPDPWKVRFEQVKRVLVALTY